MTHKPFKYSVDIRKIKQVIPHISTEHFICLYSNVSWLMLNKKSENMRLRYCDGKDKYIPPHENKRRRKNIFLRKQLVKHLILSQECLIKRTVANEMFVTNVPFIQTKLGIF